MAQKDDIVTTEIVETVSSNPKQVPAISEIGARSLTATTDAVHSDVEDPQDDIISRYYADDEEADDYINPIIEEEEEEEC